MIETKTKKIYKLQELTENLEQMHSFNSENNQRREKYKLTPSEKISFAYDFYNITGNISILEILSNIPEENEELKRPIIRFMVKYNLLKPYPNTKHYSQVLSQNVLSQLKVRNMSINSVIHEYDYQNWLELFDEDAMFEESKTKHPSYHIFLDPNGNPVKFDKELSTKVKGAIIDEGIAPARCIVEGAYPYVVNGTFQEYTDKIKTKTL